MCRTNLRVLLLDKNLSEYKSILGMIKNKSVYFLPSYLKSVQIAEYYPIKIVVFYYHDNVAIVPFVHRRINDLPMFHSLEKDYWDIITPHEYSGIILNAEGPAERSILLRGFFSAFDDYCRQERIITEFVRFDPFVTDAAITGTHHEIRHVNDNVYINLKQSEEDIWRSFENTARKNIKTAVRSGLQFCEAEGKEVDVDLFVFLYHGSMRRLGARPYYFFTREYFLSLVRECKGAKLFIVRDPDGTPLAASILLYHGDIAHHHLTGYDDAALSKRPNDFMIYQLILWARNQGLKYLHLGGGADTIRNFKAKFSPLRIPYHIGFKIHNRERYEELCTIWRKSRAGGGDSAYFPLYRAE